MASGTIDVMEVKQLTPTLTRSAGNSAVEYVHAYQYGRLIFMEVNFNKTGQTATGSNFFDGTLSGIPLPRTATNMTGFSGKSTFTMLIETNGNVKVRVTAADTTTGSYNNYLLLGGSYLC